MLHILGKIKRVGISAPVLMLSLEHIFYIKL